MLRRLYREESGGVMVITVVAALAMIGMAALAIDVGDAHLHKRRLRSATDLAALAAAQKLPSDSAATSDATSFVNTNWGKTDSTIVATTATPGCKSGGCTVHDKITVETEVDVPASFAQVFGINEFTVRGKAAATISSYTGFGANVMPFAVLDSMRNNAANYSTPFTLKSGGGASLANGDYGPVDLRTKVGGSCGINSGGSIYRDTIAGTQPECEMKVGDVFQTEPGAQTGPTAQGLDARTVNGLHIVNPLNPNTLLVTDPGTGQKMLTTVSHPNVILIPTIASWPGARKDLTIIGFTWFLITSYSGSNISGIFVRTAIAPGDLQCYQGSPATQHTCTTGSYDPNAPGATKVVSLTE